VVAISDAPVVATHSNAHALSSHSRNLTGKQLAAIRETGGLVGINLATLFLRPDGAQEGDVWSIWFWITSHTCLSRSAKTTSARAPNGAKMASAIGTAAGLQNLVEAMRNRGFGNRLIEKVCSRNWLRVLKATWGPAM
jgi:membrane dipeptidase